MNPTYWLIILAVLILIEIITLGLTTIWFAGGALVAFIISLFFDNLIVQLILFFAVSILLLCFTRPIVMKYFNPKRVRTNYEEVIGKIGLVKTQIDNMNATGLVVVDGQDWSARSSDDSILEPGERVQILSISGVKLIVTKYKED